MSLTKKIAYNTISQIGGKILSTILSLFSLALITRYLGPNGFGEYTIILTFLGFFAVFADFGLTLVTVQLISDKTRNEAKILNNLFSLRLISILAFLALAPLVAIFLPYSATIKLGLMIAIAAFIFPALNQIIIGLFQKKLCMEKSAIAEVLSKLFLLIGILLSEKLNLGLNGVLLATSFSALSSFLIHYLFSLKFACIKLEWDFSLWKEVFIKFWPLAVTIILSLVYLRADTLILSFFKTTEEVGYYGAPYKVIDVLTSLPFMFAGLILPILTTSYLEKKYQDFKKVLQKSLDYIIITAIPLVVGTILVSKEIILLIAGPGFGPSVLILQILIFSLLAIFPGTILTHAVIAIDKQKKMIPFYLFTSLSSLLAYLILIPKFSYYGAAAVTIYSEILIAFFATYCILKYTDFKFALKKSLLAILSGLAMAVFIFFFKIICPIGSSTLSIVGLLKLGLLIISSAIIYLSILFITGGLERNDLTLITQKKYEKYQK